MSDLVASLMLERELLRSSRGRDRMETCRHWLLLLLRLPLLELPILLVGDSGQLTSVTQLVPYFCVIKESHKTWGRKQKERGKTNSEILVAFQTDTKSR